MNTIGEIKYKQSKFYIYIHNEKSKITYLLINRIHREDIESGQTNHKILNNAEDFLKLNDTNYIIEGITKSKISGEISIYNSSNLLNIILSEINQVSNYSFSLENVEIDNSFVSPQGEFCKQFKANDIEHKMYFEYTMINSLENFMKIQKQDFSLEIHQSSKSFYLKELKFTKAENSVAKMIQIVTLKSLDYKTLCDTSDMSWFEEDGIRKKSYKSIKTLKEFEEEVMTPLAIAIEKAERNNEELIVALDTETTGINIYNLDKDNPDKSHCVSIQISWKDNQGVAIFTDMEHFQSLDNKYVIDRLSIFLTKSEYYKEQYLEKNKYKKIEKERKVILYKVNEETQQREISGEIIFRRSTINLVGHNVMFDGRVLYDYGVQSYFNNDTLQMAFNLNPKTVKGSNKLKVLTRKIFNHETPELSELLGKKNEDKYKYLTDELVAIIYGCADTDYTRKLYIYLKNIMSKHMYDMYQQQDVPMLNILYISEYYGLNTYADEVKTLAEATKQNLEILKKFMYDYVGQILTIKKERTILEYRKKLDKEYTEEEYKQDLENLSKIKATPYIFEIKGSQIADVLYNLLGYHCYGWTTGSAKKNFKDKKPKTDKYVMKKLISQKISKNDIDKSYKTGWKLNHNVLAYGITQYQYQEEVKNKGKEKANKTMVLIEADEFNKCKYPLALVLQKYAELNKEYTSYYKPILENNLEGKLFKSYSLARIETRRIMNPLQTIKGKLKSLVRSYNDDYYILDFDMSQMEYRIMASLAKHTSIIEKMKNPENDYHIETASLVHNIPVYRIDHKTRKDTKCIGFGVPYGLSLRSLCENLFKEITVENLIKTQKLLDKWQEANKEIMLWLDNCRDKAIEEQEISDALRDFMDMWKKDEVTGEYLRDTNGDKIKIPIGMIKNELGFYRVFNLEGIDTDSKKKATIRRASGNYPIQSYASELFRTVLLKFYNRCEEEGINNKLIWHMLIHDELLLSVHKSIHPFYMYKIIYESCMGSMQGHTNYFVGINIGNTWGDAKNDETEAPVYFVKEMKDRWDKGEFKETWIDNVSEYIIPYKKKYIHNRILTLIKRIQPDIDISPVNLPLILDKFTNYTVRAYIFNYKPNRVLEPIDINRASETAILQYEDEKWIVCFETWLLDEFGEGKDIIGINGKKYKLMRSKKEIDNDISNINLCEDDENEIISDEDYWSFEEDEFEVGYNSEIEEYDLESNEDNFSKLRIKKTNINNAKTIADIIEDDTKKYKNLTLYTLTEKPRLIVECNYSDFAIKKSVIEFFKTYKDDKGILVQFRNGMKFSYLPFKVTMKLDYSLLDEFIDNINKKKKAKL